MVYLQSLAYTGKGVAFVIPHQLSQQVKRTPFIKDHERACVNLIAIQCFIQHIFSTVFGYNFLC